MNPNYNQNYTHEQITTLLGIIKVCVDAGRYTVALNENRTENQEFIDAYRISDKKQKEIINSVFPEDFCHSLKNINAGYEYETLYVFVPQVELFDITGKVETIDVYLKFNIIETKSGRRVITISFHKCNKEVTYLFRQQNHSQAEVNYAK